MDRERILQLLEVLQGSSALELAVREEDRYVRLRRLGVAPAGSAPATSAGVTLTPAAAASNPSHSDQVEVRARLVGFFHRGQGPEGPPLVEVGAAVEEGQTIATIESLRQVTAVPAPAAGVVQEIVAEERQAVQFGDVLIILKATREA